MENTSEPSRRALWRVLGTGLVAAGGWLTLSLVLSAGSASAATGEDLLSDAGPVGSLLGQTTQTVDSVGGVLVGVAGIVPPVADQVLTPVATASDDLIAAVPVVPALLPDRPVTEVTTTVVEVTTGAVGTVGGVVGAVPGLDEVIPALPALPFPTTLPAIPALQPSAILPVAGLAVDTLATSTPTLMGPSAAVLEGRARLEFSDSAAAAASTASTDDGDAAATVVPSASSPAGAPTGVPSPTDGAVPATPTSSTSGGAPAGAAADDTDAIRAHLLPRAWSGAATSSPIPASPTYDSDTTPD